MTSKSHSVGRAASRRAWIYENLNFLGMRIKGLRDVGRIADETVAVSDEYEALSARFRGKPLKDARILEVGFGQRPVRLLTMSSLGYDVRGIDLDSPMLNHSLGSLIGIAKRNGVARAIKTAARHYLFDGIERRGLDRALRRRGKRLKIDPAIFIVGDAAETDFPPGSIDFLYSEDVFEHIPPEALDKLIAKIANWLSEDGIASITPCVYASLTGSHLVEWYPASLDDPNRNRPSAPWEHLRQRRRRADCYLNELKLAEYRQLFERHLEIVDEIDMDRDVGATYLTPEIAAELEGFERKELVGSRFRFILRRKTPN